MSATATAIVLMNGHLVIEGSADGDQFWMFFGEVVGWVRFTRLEGSEDTFVADELRLASAPELNRSASPQGVWWRRRAAIEAQRSIESFLAGGDPIR